MCGHLVAATGGGGEPVKPLRCRRPEKRGIASGAQQDEHPEHEHREEASQFDDLDVCYEAACGLGVLEGRAEGRGQPVGVLPRDDLAPLRGGCLLGRGVAQQTTKRDALDRRAPTEEAQDRGDEFDYSWTGLSGWLEKALDAAGIDSFHLVVHDLGGPVGFDLVRRAPARIRSLTVLNTLVAASRFTKPRMMRPFSVPGLRRVWLRQLDSPGIYPFFRWKGVLDGPSYEEVRAYGRLLVRGDGGDAFLRIMDGFETTAAFESRIRGPLRDREFPAQVIWGRRDQELTVDEHGADVVEALGLTTPLHVVEAKHFLQEDVPEELAERISLLVERGTDV